VDDVTPGHPERLYYQTEASQVKFEYNEATDTGYVRLEAGKVARSELLGGRVVVDYDAHGVILGVELLW